MKANESIKAACSCCGELHELPKMQHVDESSRDLLCAVCVRRKLMLLPELVEALADARDHLKSIGRFRGGTWENLQRVLSKAAALKLPS